MKKIRKIVFVLILFFSFTAIYSQSNWWLEAVNCGSTYVICCCDNGNSQICEGPAYFFMCIGGGVFQCLSSYGDCEGFPNGSSQVCMDCCNPCQYAFNPRIDANSIVYTT